MQGSIAQLLALTVYGNEFLRGRDIGDFWPSAPVFMFCRRVAFVLAEPGQHGEVAYAPDPPGWLERLRADGVVGLRLHQAPQSDSDRNDRMTVGFVGGGRRWMIEAVKKECSDVWEPRWELGDADAPDRRIWNVTYGRTTSNYRHMDPAPVDVERVRVQIDAALAAMTEFAETHGVESFAASFRAGRVALASDGALQPPLDMPAVGRLALPYKRLLAAAQAAWVFGGMGSWNDMSFEGTTQKRYDRLSDDLFMLLNEAVALAASSSFRTAGAQS